MFGIKSSIDRLNLLKADYEKLEKDALDVSLAEKACSDAWHLSDWVFREKKEADESLTLEKFRIQLYRECPEMKILHDIANGIKHKKLKRPKVRIKEIEKQKGAYSFEYSDEYDISRYEVYFGDNSKIDVNVLLKIAIDFWTSKIIPKSK